MLSESRPLVTIVTLVYNTGVRMPDTLASIKAQTYASIEHIIIDDCSTDDSADKVQAWVNKTNHSCTFIRHERNVGICATVNEALRLAKGKYLSLIGDDIMLSYKIERDVAFMEAHSDYAFCYSNMILRYIDEDQEVAAHTSSSNNLFHDYLSGKADINTPTVMYRRSALEAEGGFDENILFEDYDMYLRLLYKHPAGFNNYYSVVYMIWKKSIQSERQVELLNEFFKILSKWKMLPKYSYYKNNRHQYTFCQLAVKNKKEAIKHLVPAIKVFWKPRLYNNLLKFMLVWK